MTYELLELVLPLTYTDAEIIRAAAKRLHLETTALTLVKILRRAVDARARRGEPCYVLNVVVNIACPAKIDLKRIKKIAPYSSPATPEIFSITKNPVNTGAKSRPLIIGAGPAGLAAAYYLAQRGARPLILERGAPLEKRKSDVGDFWAHGVLHSESNVLFGEGGAGAFSDGKLTARSKDRERKNFVLQMLVDHGAAAEILYDAQPHLGSDLLAEILPRLRATIIQHGGEFHFNTRVEELIIEAGVLRGVKVLATESPAKAASPRTIIETQNCLLATGHSADDTYSMLAANGVALQSKDYAIGVRVELAQTAVNRVQYGREKNSARFAPQLGAASFFLTAGGLCHTFCMCPGGRVIACAVQAGRLTTNGMSLSTRAGVFANAAFLIPQKNHDADFFTTLARLQHIERAAFQAGGGDYQLPATTLAAFPAAAKILPPRSIARATAADFREFLPAEVTLALGAQLPKMLQRFAVAPEEIILYGAETRSTAPLRILRHESGESINVRGLFPLGEGAGYAGGIISSAIDGVKTAEKILTINH